MGRGVVAVAVLPLLFCRCRFAVAVSPLLCSLAVRGGCFVAIVVVLIVAVPLCRLAFFLIAVMLNLFQHPVAFKKTKLSTNYITGFLSACLNHIKLEKEYSPCK